MQDPYAQAKTISAPHPAERARETAEQFTEAREVYRQAAKLLAEKHSAWLDAHEQLSNWMRSVDPVEVAKDEPF